MMIARLYTADLIAASACGLDLDLQVHSFLLTSRSEGDKVEEQRIMKLFFKVLEKTEGPSHK